MTFEHWTRRFWHTVLADDEASLAAYVDGDLAGLTMLRVDRPTRRAQNNLTGVRPTYRGRGLARLLKTHSLARAAAMGVTSAITDNDERNAPMLAVEPRARLPAPDPPGRVGAPHRGRIGSPSMGLLDGKVAIVTGAGRGIGRGEALELAPRGRTGRGQRARRRGRPVGGRRDHCGRRRGGARHRRLLRGRHRARAGRAARRHAGAGSTRWSTTPASCATAPSRR